MLIMCLQNSDEEYKNIRIERRIDICEYTEELVV